MHTVTGELLSWGRYLCSLQSVFHCIIPKSPHHQLVFRHLEWRFDATLTEILQHKEVTLREKVLLEGMSRVGNSHNRGEMETINPVVAFISPKDSFKHKVTPSPHFFY